MNTVVTKLQNTAAANRTRLATLETERANALDTITDEYYRKIGEYTRTYDDAAAEATAAIEQAEADILREKAEHAVEDQRLREGVTQALGTNQSKRRRWADHSAPEKRPAGEEEDSDLDEQDDVPDVPVHTVLAVDTTATAPAINQALGFSGDKMLSPEIIGHILQAHLKAAAELQEAADAERQAQHVAQHTAHLDEVRKVASAERDARHAERLKAQEDAEEKEDVNALNGDARPSRPSKARARSRTPPNEQEDPPMPPLPPQQPTTGSPTVVACAVIVKSKTMKNQEKRARKNAKKQNK